MQALREARRVLKPGGRFLCLEFSKVEVPGLDTLYDAYSFKLLPKIGGWWRRTKTPIAIWPKASAAFRRRPSSPRMIARGGAGPGQGAQSLRRHRRHAFGLASVDGRRSSSLRLSSVLAAPLAGAGARPCRAASGRDAGARLARALERLGPAYIKLGQMLATRPDIVGEEVASALEHLQDRLPPFPEAQARARDRQAPSASRWKRCSPAFGAPLAAASIAQVHRAQTSDGAGAVAVKMLRPGIESEFARDLEALAFFARMAERFSAEARRLRLIALVETLAASVALELDLRMEAAAASELYERTRGDAEFRVPHVDWTPHRRPGADQRMDRRHVDARCRGACAPPGMIPRRSRCW